MAKTALELTPEEWRASQPAQRQATQQATARWQRAWDVARLAANLLREQCGAQRVVVFGSLTCAAWFTPWSDIDVAAWGIPARDFYRAVLVSLGGYVQNCWLSPTFWSSKRHEVIGSPMAACGFGFSMRHLAGQFQYQSPRLMPFCWFVGFCWFLWLSQPSHPNHTNQIKF